MTTSGKNLIKICHIQPPLENGISDTIAQMQSGICKRSFQLLKEKAAQMKRDGKQLFCGLIHDEMNIREHIQWLNNKNEFSGLITFGKITDEEETLPLATQVLVYMVSGINANFHLPITCYFINKIDGIDKIVLQNSIVKALHNDGVKVLTSTFDGHPTNITASEILGCSFDLNNFEPYYPHPEDGTPIHTFFDPPHMLKLVRNTLGKRKKLFDRLGRAIEWKYFEQLAELRQTENFISHKLTKSHVDYENNKMKVSLAAQTFSQSVANAFQSLKQRNYPGFEDVDGTNEFCRRFDRLFNILNSTAEESNDDSKRPITEESKEGTFSFLEDTFNYIQNLTFDPFKNFVLNSRLKVGFKGMLINIENVKNIFSNFVQTKEIEQFPIRNIVQCSLESFFGRCRSHSMLGNNTNPTVAQFNAVFRKLMVNNEVTCSELSNCSDRLDILSLSSRISSTPQHSTQSNEHLNQSRIQLNDSEIVNCDIQANLDDDDDDEHHKITEPSNKEIGIAFIAGQIDGRIEKNGMRCDLCAYVVTENQKLDMTAFPVAKMAKVPCLSTFEICKLADMISTPKLLCKSFNYVRSCNDIYQQVPIRSMYSESNFDFHSNHKEDIVKYVIATYLSMRATEMAKMITIETQIKRNEKRNSKKIAHFKGN